MKWFRNGLILICILISMVACAVNQQWRADSTDLESKNLDSVVEGSQYKDLEEYKTTLGSEPGVESGNTELAAVKTNKTAYIEFDEKGDFLDRQQLVDAVANIPVSERRLIIFYAHGWQNNTRSGDVALFNMFLAHLQHVINLKLQGKQQWQVYGVYLSWRGTDFDPSQFYLPHPSDQIENVYDIPSKGLKDNPWNDLAGIPKVFTFWDRKTAAERVAGAPLVQAITDISLAARTERVTQDDDRCRVVLMGHSFGAYVIEKSVLQAITSESATEGLDKISYVTPPADLVILLNSAAPAVYAKEFIEFFKWHGVTNTSEHGRPFIVSVTSETDLATKILFPIATAPGTTFAGGDYEGRSSVSYGGVGQSVFFTHTPGHCDYLISHDVYPTNQDSPKPLKPRNKYEWLFSYNLNPNNFSQDPLSFYAWNNSAYGLSYPPGLVEAKAQLWNIKSAVPADPKEGPIFNDTPYWVIRVPKTIIVEHGDVWSPNSMNLLSGLVRLTGIGTPQDGDQKGSEPRTLTLLPNQKPKNDNLVLCAPYCKQSGD